jgi:hypothetical protein
MEALEQTRGDEVPHVGVLGVAVQAEDGGSTWPCTSAPESGKSGQWKSFGSGPHQTETWRVRKILVVR